MNPNKKQNFTSTLPDNPFDIFKGRKIPVLIKEPVLPTNTIDETKFINFLKKRIIPIKKQIFNKNMIYKEMRIFSPNPLLIKEEVYYKYPFCDFVSKINNDYFIYLYNDWIKALNSALFNYKNKKSHFFIKIKNDIFIFKDDILVSKGLKDSFISNDINFTEKEDFLFIENNELIFLCDYLLNMPVNNDFIIPFILSKDQFINSMFYSVKVTQMPIVQNKNKINYHYEIEGYFLGSDYEEYFNLDIKLK